MIFYIGIIQKLFKLMKMHLTSKPVLLLVFGLLCLTSHPSYSQRPIEVLVTVNTEIITEDNVDEAVTLSDSDHTSTPGSNSQFTTKIEKGAKIKWKGTAEDGNSGDKVKLKVISIKNGTPRVLEKARNRGDSSGAVNANVRSQNVTVGDEDEYEIIFEVKKQGGKKVEYKLDPKLRIRA